MKQFFSELLSWIAAIAGLVVMLSFVWGSGYRSGRETSRERLVEIQNRMVAAGFAEYRITTNGVEWKVRSCND